jgi:hypothetical protein
VSGRARWLGGGLALAAIYVLALVITTGGSSPRARPLYDGLVPLPTYRWVAPPAFFASGNRPPQPSRATIALGADGSELANVATPDGQLTLSLAAGAIAPHPGARRIAVSVTPLDPDDVAPVPAGLRANGNAYRVRMEYEPGGQPVRSFATPGTLVLQVPEIGRSLFSSPTGHRWTAVAATPLPPRELSLSAPFAAPGYVVGGTRLPELAAPGDSGSNAVRWGVGVGAAAVLLVGAAAVVRRRRSARPEDGGSDPVSGVPR